MTDKCGDNRKLRRSDLPKLESWIKKKGWTVGVPSGNFVVLRARKDKRFVTLYGAPNHEHLSWTKIHDEIVNEFMGEVIAHD